jgi:hypothetical protein
MVAIAFLAEGVTGLAAICHYCCYTTRTLVLLHGLEDMRPRWEPK